jgi:hypothetical protein
MTDEPGIIDGEILEEMKNLELLISFHKKAIERRLEPELVIPKEIKTIVNYRLALTSWSNQKYDTLRIVYAEAWVEYYTRVFSEEIYYSTSDLAEYFKIS